MAYVKEAMFSFIIDIFSLLVCSFIYTWLQYHLGYKNIKWKTEKYHTVGTVPKSNSKIVELYSTAHFTGCTGSSIKTSGVKLVLLT